LNLKERSERRGNVVVGIGKSSERSEVTSALFPRVSELCKIVTDLTFKEISERNEVGLTLLPRILERSKIVACLDFEERSERSEAVLASLPSISERNECGQFHFKER
jgi:hypothetical protein